MTEDQGRAAFFAQIPVPRETRVKLERFADIVQDEGRIQNLIAASTLPSFWHRHMLDSAQLLSLAHPGARQWLDVGSGAGFPGVVLAILSDDRHLLVEPRRLRANFLLSVVNELDLGDRVSVLRTRVQRVVHSAFDVITARAFSSLAKTIEATIHLAHRETQWLLHKGEKAAIEAADAAQTWDGKIELVPSITDPTASIAKLGHMRRRLSR